MIIQTDHGGYGKQQFLLIVLMNIIIYPLIIIWSMMIIFFSPVLIAVIKLFTFRELDRIVRLIIWLYGRGWLLIMSPFVKFETEGPGFQAIEPPCILVVNHQSFFDIYCMALLPTGDVVFAVRSWPFKIPWYTPFMRMSKYLEVERWGWRKITESARALLNRKITLLFFPEGHRSRDGRPGRFYSGAFKVAIDTNTRVVPLCISGTHDLLPPGRWWIKPAKVTLKALEPVFPEDFAGPMAHSDMRKFVKNKITGELSP